MRKGYEAERTAKKKLIEMYGDTSVFKLAIGQHFDFLVLEPKSPRIKKLVEIKSFGGKRKYYNKRERMQIKKIRKILKSHGIYGEVWEMPKNKKTIYIRKI